MALPTPLQAFSGVPKINTAPDKQTIVDGEKMTGAQALIRSLEDLASRTSSAFLAARFCRLPRDQRQHEVPLRAYAPRAGRRPRRRRLRTGHWQGGRVHRDFRPGATNVVTAIADANMDSVPMVVITGQVGVQASALMPSRRRISWASPTRCPSTPSS